MTNRVESAPHRLNWQRLRRIIFSALCVIGGTALFSTTIVGAPWEETKTQEIGILPGNYIPKDGQSPFPFVEQVHVSESQFLKLAEGSDAFLYIGDESVQYLTVIEDVIFYHYQRIKNPPFYSYHQGDESTYDSKRNTLKRTLQADWSGVVFNLILSSIPFILLWPINTKYDLRSRVITYTN